MRTAKPVSVILSQPDRQLILHSAPYNEVTNRATTALSFQIASRHFYWKCCGCNPHIDEKTPLITFDLSFSFQRNFSACPMLPQPILSLLLILALCAFVSVRGEPEQGPDYGVDVVRQRSIDAAPIGAMRYSYWHFISLLQSYPMHHASVSTNYAWLPHNVDPENNPTPEEFKDVPIQPLGDMQSKHEKFIQGCIDHYGHRGQRCVDNEEDRIQMTLRQPQSMNNYTALGYTKIRAPDGVFRLIKEFWDKNRDTQSSEAWAVGNIYVNHWAAPSYLVSVENQELEGGGYGRDSSWPNAVFTAFVCTRRAPCSHLTLIDCPLSLRPLSMSIKTSMSHGQFLQHTRL
jgi:hypothetical protein